MRLNVCINGTFRYPDYIRHYAEAGVLGRFIFAHRRSRSAKSFGLSSDACRNIWPKHYAAAALFRAAPAAWAPGLTDAVCDAWQTAAIRDWVECDNVEVVIGAVADRVIAHARRQGARVLGHPVTTHPVTLRRLVDAARIDVGLQAEAARCADLERREAEIESCDKLLVDSAFVARSFLDNGVPRDRIAIVRPALDHRAFAARAPDDRDRACFTVVSVGTITPRKAQHVLLRAWAKLRLCNARLILVGPRGRDAAAVLDGHAGRFTHIPALDHAALRALLIRASCFVLVSAEDGFAQAPYEAMACGLPVIVSETMGVAGLIRPGIDGFVVPPLDPDALAAVLLQLYRDPTRADAVGGAAAASVERGGTWRAYVNQVLDIHRELLGPGRRRMAA